MRVRPTRSRARCALSGGSATARSAITSTAVPPCPNSTIGPKSASSARPTISSSAPGRRTIGCTMKPSSFASGRSARSRSAMRSAASRTLAASARSSATPPTSDLCVTSGERILSAAGKPSSAAMRAASSGSRAMRVATIGIP